MAAVDRGVDEVGPGKETHLVEPDPCLEIVYRPDGAVVLGEPRHAQVLPEVTFDGPEPDAGVHLGCAPDDGCCLAFADVRFAQEHAAREVVHLDLVEIVEVDRTDAEQCEVLHDLVADRAGTNDDDTGTSAPRPAKTSRSARAAGNGRYACQSRAIATARNAVPPHEAQRPELSRTSTVTLSE